MWAVSMGLVRVSYNSSICDVPRVVFLEIGHVGVGAIFMVESGKRFPNYFLFLFIGLMLKGGINYKVLDNEDCFI